MSLESEYGIGPGEEAAIADHFRSVDTQLTRNLDPFHAKMVEYLSRFGSVHFDALEEIFRKNNFNVHQLAVPSRFLETQFPGHVVADVNTYFNEKLIVPRPFGVITCRSFDHLQAKATEYNVLYNPPLNLKRLKRAGDLVGNPQAQRVIFLNPPSLN